MTSKGLLLYANQEYMDPTGGTVHTLSLPVSSEMAPTFKVLVYHVTEDGEVLSDAITLPVEGIGSRTVRRSRDAICNRGVGRHIWGQCQQNGGRLAGCRQQNSLVWGGGRGAEVCGAGAGR